MHGGGKALSGEAGMVGSRVLCVEELRPGQYLELLAETAKHTQLQRRGTPGKSKDKEGNVVAVSLSLAAPKPVEGDLMFQVLGKDLDKLECRLSDDELDDGSSTTRTPSKKPKVHQGSARPPVDPDKMFRQTQFKVCHVHEISCMDA